MFVCGCFAPVFLVLRFLQFVGLRCLQSFFWRLFFATCSVARAAASRRGSSPLRLSPDSLLRRLRSLRSERAYVVSSQALLRSALCCFRAEVRGASFASLRRAGLRLARLKPVFSSVNCNYPSKSSGFYEFGLHSTLVDLRTNRTSFPSTFPRCRQLHIPVCGGVCEQCTSNGHFKVFGLAPGAGSR